MTAAVSEGPLVERLLALALITRDEVPTLRLQRATRARYVLTDVHVGRKVRFVVKTARAADAEPLLLQEAAVLRWLATASPPVASPGCLFDGSLAAMFDGADEGPPTAAHLVMHHVGMPQPWCDGAADATRLAAALAALHVARAAPPGIGHPDAGRVDAQQPMAMLPVSVVRAFLLPRLEEAAADDPGTAGALRYLSSSWINGAAIHGDVKWEHVCGAQRAVLVDWELGGVGDPAWDVASLLHELVGMGADGAVLGTCLTAYSDAVRRRLSHAFLMRCTAALAIRFVQSAGEHASAGAASVVVQRSARHARWWAAHPDALDACLREAA